jgi:hypothetical protein
MDQPFESDVMDDLAAETPLSSAHTFYDDYDNAEDEYDEEDSFSDHADDYGDSQDSLTDLDHHFDVAIHQELSGGSAVKDVSKTLESAIVAALATPTTDTFLRRLNQDLRQIASEPDLSKNNGKRRKAAHKPANSPGRSLAPVTTLVAQLARSGADIEEALHAFLDLAETEPVPPSVAPVIAGLSLHSTMPDALKGARAQRQRLLQSVIQATQTLAQQQGSQAMGAIPRILEVVQRNALEQQIPSAELPGAIQRITRQVAANGDLVQRLAHTLHQHPAPQRIKETVTPGTVKRLVFDRPVELTIRYL